MPFKKHQSLTDTTAENKRVRGGWFGRQWTPRRAFSLSGLRSDSRTPHRKRQGTYLRGRLPAVISVVCWRRQHFVFLIRTIPCPNWNCPAECLRRFALQTQLHFPIGKHGVHLQPSAHRFNEVLKRAEVD